MAASQFLAYATAGGANVVDQATYAASSYVTAGRGSGILPSNVYNKIARQAAFGTAALAQFMVNQLGQDVLDNGDLTAFINQLTAAIQTAALQPATTGDAKLTLKNVADSGWLLMNDGTIGNASSGAGYANVAANALFVLIWNNVTSTYAPLYSSAGAPTTRGVSAAADWAANCRLSLTLQLGRALCIAGAGTGLTARLLGQTLGEETHLLTVPEMPSHSHTPTTTVTDPTHQHTYGTSASGGGGFASGSGNGSVINTGVTATAATGITVSVSNANTGGGGSHNNMQPSAFWSIMIKLALPFGMLVPITHGVLSGLTQWLGC